MLLELLLHGRFGASEATLAWQAQQFDSLGTAGARLEAAGFGVFAWQVQHLVLLELFLRGRY